MFEIFKKIKSWFVDDAEAVQAPVAPYKIEAPVAANSSSFKDVEIAPKSVKLRQPGQSKQGAKKPAQGKKPQGQKPAGQKPAGQKKPAQPKQNAGQKPAGQKPRSRKPKANPAAE